MAEFGFTEEQSFLRHDMEEWCTKNLADGAKQRSKLDYIPKEIIQKLADRGLLALQAPAEYGGQEIDWVSFGIIIEEIAKVDFPPTQVVLQNVLGFTYLKFASEELRKFWIPDMVKGEKSLCMGITEPESGSDAAALKSTARLDGDKWVLNGEKTAVTRGMQATGGVYQFRTGPDKHRGIDAFVVPNDFPGISRSVFNDMGWKPLNRCSVFFDDVKVPREFNITANSGGSKDGFMGFIITGDIARVAVSLMALGLAEGALKDTITYIKERHAFGRPIGKFEGIQFELAEVATVLDTCKMLCYRALWMRDHNMNHTKESSMAKWYVSYETTNAIRKMLVMFGHYGYCDEHFIESRYRDCFGFQIADGTAHIQKIIVAREILGKEFRPF